MPISVMKFYRTYIVRLTILTICIYIQIGTISRVYSKQKETPPIMCM